MQIRCEKYVKPYKITKAFTLAEVLVTLAVIGVVAALTIPAITQNIQDAQYKTAWKKTYSYLNQAMQRILIDNGGTFKGLCDLGNGTAAANDCFKNQFKTYLNYAKDCIGTDNTTLGNCWHNQGVVTYLNGTTGGAWLTTYGGLILSNGDLLIFRHERVNCDRVSGSFLRCGWITVDINGFKPPNRWGKDIFEVYVMENSNKPAGIMGSGVGIEGTCSPNNVGTSCSTDYLMQ